MAQWEELLRLDLLQGQLGLFYEIKFPRHLRHCLCFYIESQDWDSAAVDESKAKACFLALLAHLDQQCTRSIQESSFLSGPDYPGMKAYLMKNFQDDPQKLAGILSVGLREEKKVLATAAQKKGRSSPLVEEKWRVLDSRVNELQRQTTEIKEKIKLLEQLYETHDYIVKTWQSNAEQYVGTANVTVREKCLAHASSIQDKKQNVLEDMQNILKETEQIVLVLVDAELPEWKRRQQMACIGSPVDTCLIHLQKWFTAIAGILIEVRQQLQKLQDQNKKYDSPDTSSQPEETEKIVLCLLTALLTNALVVEKQPVMSSIPQRPLILKTGVRFSATVRFLANLPEFKCLLKVKPVFDKDVEETMTMNGLRHFKFNREDSKVMDVDPPGDGLVAQFSLLSLKEKGVRSRGSCESRLIVTEELHIINFVASFQYSGLKFNIEVNSLPVVVISATSQIPCAWASVMWYNIVSTSELQSLLLFANPPPVSWQQLSQVLSWQFLSVGQRELDENQLSMLRDKVVDNPEGLIPWSKFKSENVWIWIEAILDLIKRHLVELWQKGYIMGFVSRKTTQLLLQEKTSGTFLLRFSESIKDGAITFSWVEHCISGEAYVHAVEPYTKKDLEAMSMPDILYLYSLKAQDSMTRNPLLYLYPDIPRDAAFGRYYSSEKLAPKKDQSGYIDRRLVPFSVYPTPPSSPPRHMDVDQDMSAEDQRIQEILHDLFSL